MKKIITATMALVMAASMTACGIVESSRSKNPGANVSTVAASETATKTTTNTTTTITTTAIEEETMAHLAGGWSAVSGDTSLSANAAAKSAFEKVASTLCGMEYEPISVLATQVVSGTNYCILCRGKATVPNAQPVIQLVYIYENLQGKAELTNTKTIIDSEMLDGGFTANDGDIQLEKNSDVKTAFEKATQTLTGAELEPVAYLGSQVVAGSNYLVLCKQTATVPGAEPEFSLATVYSDLEGNAEIKEIEEIVFGEYDSAEEND